jgi:AcrR family transcriptional regulator
LQQRSEETRASILTAAQNLFAKSGYDGTGVAEICASAGVSKGAFYHHFETKQDVFLALLDDWLKGLDRGIQTILGGAVDAPSALVKIASLSPMVFSAADGRLSMFLEFWSQSSHHPAFWQAAVAPYRRYQQLFQEIVQRGIEDGSLLPVDAATTSRLILATVMGLLLQGLFDPEAADWSSVTQASMQTLVNGISRRKS